MGKKWQSENNRSKILKIYTLVGLMHIKLGLKEEHIWKSLGLKEEQVWNCFEKTRIG